MMTVLTRSMDRNYLAAQVVTARASRAAPLRPLCARAHLRWCNVTRGVRTCTPVVVQRHAGCVHVYTDNGAASRGVCARVHRRRCSVTRGVRTCTPEVVQRHTGRAHVYTGRGATMVIGDCFALALDISRQATYTV